VAYKLELLTQYGAVALTVSVLIFGMMAHWLACFWYLIGYRELNAPNGNIQIIFLRQILRRKITAAFV